MTFGGEGHLEFVHVKHFLENADEILQFWSPVLNPTNHGRRSLLYHVTQFGPDLFFCSGFSCFLRLAGLVNTARTSLEGFGVQSPKHLEGVVGLCIVG